MANDAISLYTFRILAKIHASNFSSSLLWYFWNVCEDLSESSLHRNDDIIFDMRLFVCMSAYMHALNVFDTNQFDQSFKTVRLYLSSTKWRIFQQKNPSLDVQLLRFSEFGNVEKNINKPVSILSRLRIHIVKNIQSRGFF